MALRIKYIFLNMKFCALQEGKLAAEDEDEEISDDAEEDGQQ